MYTTVYLAIGNLNSKGSEALLEDMNINVFELKFKLIQKLNGEINRIAEEQSNMF